MNLKNYQITVGEVLQNPNAIPLKDVIHYAGGYVSQRKMQNILDQLSRL